MSKKHSVSAILLASLLTLTFSSLMAGDWPQWRGPNRDDVSKETGLLQKWPSSGPKVLWVNKDGGLGYAGFAVVGDTMYTMGLRGETEYLLAIKVSDGKEKWAKPIGKILKNGWGDGPRSTPTVDGDYIYAMGGRGGLHCFKASNGAPVWDVSMTSDLGGKVPNWGYTESPLVDGPIVICTPGGKKGAIVALDKKTGKIKWRSKSFTDRAEYSSVIKAEHNGQRQYIQLTQKSVVGVNAKNGNVLWKTDWPGRVAVIPTPIFAQGHVYITSGYGVGCNLYEINKSNKVSAVYEDSVKKIMKNHHGGVIKVGDYLYGYSDGVGWTCQDFKTGKKMWNEKRALGKGCISYADNRFYCVDERNGDVVLIEASPKGWSEKGRFTLSPQTKNRNPRGKIWVHPVIANGKMYLRDQEIIICYDISAK